MIRGIHQWAAIVARSWRFPIGRNARYFSQAARMCHYKVLNVSTDASFDEIKSSYFALAKLYHPDTNQGDPVQELKFREVLDAYNILSDSESRMIYDKEIGVISTWANEHEAFKTTTGKTSGGKAVTEENAEEMFQYYEAKYFNNPELYKKKVIPDDELELTDKLYQQYKQRKDRQKKDGDWVVYNPHSHLQYWESKENEKKYATSERRLGALATEFLPIAIGCAALALGWVFYHSDKNEKPQKASK
jgi:curved DNA-binding protein CbpA